MVYGRSMKGGISESRRTWNFPSPPCCMWEEHEGHGFMKGGEGGREGEVGGESC